MDKFGVLEKQFDYKGHDCICIFNCLGYRCGYVSVDDYKDCYEYDIDCHCGLSFGASRLPLQELSEERLWRISRRVRSVSSVQAGAGNEQKRRRKDEIRRKPPTLQG